jgi:hypothetical protein
MLDIEFSDGHVTTYPQRSPTAPKPRKPAPDQGSLF